MSNRPAYILSGPTASGKSALAMEMALKCNGVIINADVMQLYAALPILTAQPSAADCALVPHVLYGQLAADDVCHAARWVDMAAGAMRTAWDAGQTPFLVGGTGMYIQSLVRGIARLPAIDDTVRQVVREQAQHDLSGLYKELQQADNAAAARIKPTDPQRICRAVEVYRSTHLPLTHWQQQKTKPVFDDVDYHCVPVVRPRAELIERINARVYVMIEQGALDEVARLDAAPDWPIYKAHGYREFRAFLRGEISRDTAIAQTQLATRQYAKRQMTWLRGQSWLV